MCTTVLPTLRFSRQFGLVFFVDLLVFLKTCGLLVFGLVFTEFCSFFGLVFCRFLFCGLLCFKFDGNFLFQFAPKGILGVFL